MESSVTTILAAAAPAFRMWPQCRSNSISLSVQPRWAPVSCSLRGIACYGEPSSRNSEHLRWRSEWKASVPSKWSRLHREEMEAVAIRFTEDRSNVSLVSCSVPSAGVALWHSAV